MKKLGFGLMRLPLLDQNDAGSIDIEETKMLNRKLYPSDDCKLYYPI